MKPCQYGHTTGRNRYLRCIQCHRDANARYQKRSRKGVYGDTPELRNDRGPALPARGVHCPRPGAHIFKKTVDPDAFYAKIESYRRKI